MKNGEDDLESEPTYDCKNSCQEENIVSKKWSKVVTFGASNGFYRHTCCAKVVSVSSLVVE